MPSPRSMDSLSSTPPPSPPPPRPLTVSRVARRLLRLTLIFIFGTVGVLLGAITGGMIGLATESGVFRGSGIGAISGAVFSMEVVESSVALWQSSGSRLWSILYVIEILYSLLCGRLVREKIDPAVQSAVRSQISAVRATPFMEEAIDIFETGGTQGMAEDSVDRLPKFSINVENDVDASGEKICCSVCLQDFQIGETVRSLPHCQHMYHLPCIDSWLIRHGSCPLCRHDY